MDNVRMYDLCKRFVWIVWLVTSGTVASTLNPHRIAVFSQ